MNATATLVCDLTDLDADDDGTNDLSLYNTDCDDDDAMTVGDDDLDDGFYSTTMVMTVTTTMRTLTLVSGLQRVQGSIGMTTPLGSV